MVHVNISGNITLKRHRYFLDNTAPYTMQCDAHKNQTERNEYYLKSQDMLIYRTRIHTVKFISYNESIVWRIFTNLLMRDMQAKK